MKILLKEFRAEFLTASVLPVIAAVVLANHETGSFSMPLFCLTLAGAVFLHLGTNIANDYYDHLSGDDAANTEYVRPFTGGSRLIQEERIQPPVVLAMSIFFFTAALLVGVILLMIRGPIILAFGLAGLFLGFFYTAPPFHLANRGLGEIAVGIGFGLIPLGAYFVQTGAVSVRCVVATLPLALFTTAIILINEFQDFKADGIAGKRTLVVRLGRKNSVYLFALVIFSAFLPVIVGTIAGLMPPSTLIVLLSLPLAVKAVANAGRHYDDPEKLSPSNGLTIACQALTGILLAAAYIIS